MKPNKTLLAAAAAMSALAAGTAGAETYSYASFNAPSHIMVRTLGTGWADQVREATGGEVDFEIFPGASLMPPLSMLQGVGDGLATAAHLAVPYYASDLPINYVAGELGFANPDYFALAFAYADYIVNDAAAHGEWRAQNVVPMGTISTPNYFYVCKDVVTDMAGLQGKKVRSPGGAWGRFTTDIGFVAVSIPYNELFTSMERNAVDCAAMSTSDLVSGATVLELVKSGSVLKIPLSPGYNSSHNAINEDVWKSLTDDQRRAILDAIAVGMVRAHIGYEAEVAEAEQAGRDAGMVFVEEMDDEIQAFYDDWNTKNLQIVIDAARERGLEDPAAVLDSMQSYIDKWNGLIDGVARDDEAALTAILKENLFDQIDETAYGMD